MAEAGAREQQSISTGDAGPTDGEMENRGATAMTSESPLLRMARETPTQWWNDSCDPGELVSAIERGATGATSNPTIVLQVMKKHRDIWWPRTKAIADAHPSWSEVEIAWAVVEELAANGASILKPVFDASGGRKGRQTVQTNPALYRDDERMVEQAVRFHGLAPNIQVKFPGTPAGLAAVEEGAFRGVSTMLTVSFTVSQAVAAAEAAERGLARRASAGLPTDTVTPIAVLMIGRLDDWMKVLVERDGLAVDPAAPNWAGIAVFKRTYELFVERKFHSGLLAAATRHPLHWTELVGADAMMTLTAGWQARFDSSGIVPTPRIEVPVDKAIIDELSGRIPDFVRAYEPGGLSIDEFESFGATARTLRAFIASYHDLLGTVRDITLPDPDHGQS
jgi:transaldolase